MTEKKYIETIEPWQELLDSEPVYGPNADWHHRLNEKMKEIIDKVNQLIRNQS